MIRRLGGWRPWGLSALSGLLMALGDPGYGLDLLVWVGLVPLLSSLDKKSCKERFGLGWLAGFAFFLLILPWLWTLWDWAGGGVVVAYVALSALMGLSWGLWAAGCGLLAGDWPGRALLAAPALWIGLEFLRASGRLGFSWGTLGVDLHAHPLALQPAAWTGVWGLSALIVFVNASLHWSLRQRRWRGAAWAVVVLLLWLGWGGWIQGGLSAQLASAPTVKLALVQANLSQREKTDPALLEDLQARYQALLEQVPQVDVVVLSESILPALVLEDEELLGWLQAFARARRAAVLFGTFAARQADLFNSVALLNPEGELRGSYDKVQLVPFSTEYFPMIDQLKGLGLNRWLGPLPLGALTAGRGFEPLTLNDAATVGTPICFESAFSRISRAFVRRGATLLITLTNDAWFKRSMELKQHFAMGAVRAVETGRSFVQVANTGLSGAFSPTGRLLARLPAQRAAVATVDVPLMNGKTPYVRWGGWAVGLAGAVLLGLALLALRGQGPQGDQSSQPSM